MRLRCKVSPHKQAQRIKARQTTCDSFLHIDSVHLWNAALRLHEGNLPKKLRSHELHLPNSLWSVTSLTSALWPFMLSFPFFFQTSCPVRLVNKNYICFKLFFVTDLAFSEAFRAPVFFKLERNFLAHFISLYVSFVMISGSVPASETEALSSVQQRNQAHS